MSKQLIASYVRDLEPFPVDNRGFYHNIMSLIISQRIRFKQVQRIRLNIYQVLNDFKLDNVMSLTFEQRKQCKLNDDKWQIMKRFHDMKETLARQNTHTHTHTPSQTLRLGRKCVSALPLCLHID